MKQETDDLFLRGAFRQEPEACHAALMRAARSAKEETKTKRTALRVVLMTALVITAMAAVAFAVGNTGLVDWFGTHYNIVIPQTAQDILSSTEQKTFVTGPVSFTVLETLADGRVAYLTVEAKTADGSAAILYPGTFDPNDRIGATVAAALKLDGVSATSTFAEAAQTTGLPLYSVDAWLIPKNQVIPSEEMLSPEFREDGSILLIDMLYTDPDAVGDTLTADIEMRAAELDPKTLERRDDGGWKAVDARAIPVSGVVARRTYAVASGENLGGKFTVTSVTAEQTGAGVYVTVHATVDGGIALPALWGGKCFAVLDAQGNPYPPGISLIAERLDGDGGRFPVDPDYRVYSLQYRVMITADELPDSLIVSNFNTQVLLEALPADPAR